MKAEHKEGRDPGVQAPRPRDRYAIPPGQPRPIPRIKLHLHKKSGRQLPAHVYPHQVCNVRSPKDLEGYMEHYSHPFPMMDGSPYPKNPRALRYLAEWVFPALRWFCRAYGEDIPGWLKRGKTWADGMNPKDHKKFFGTDKPLNIREWKEDPHAAGERA